jgi:S-DNA-T family DNA segregation ATPase FtsK/SpoIIIE
VHWGRDLLLVDDPLDAPHDRTQVLLTSPTEGVVRRPQTQDQRFVPTLLSLPLARHLARTMAPLVAAGAGSPASPTPAVTTALGDLLVWPHDEAAVVAGWSGPVCLRVPVGTDGSGATATVDLAREGPHALVAGTTGSGKSELLRTLVTALALRNPPDRLALLLVDYKGGSSLGDCAGLPHTTGLVTDLDPHLGERVLTSLRAELRRRESRLVEAGVRDVRDYAGNDVPRLVVVVDEFRVLAEELPDVLAGLVRVATVGRSLGVHLVLATQRPAGVVSADLRANVNLRIALRVRDAADSLDVLEVADAAHLPEGRPGAALVRTGASPVRALQVAPAGPGHRCDTEEAWEVEEAADVWDAWRRVRLPTPTLSDPRDNGLGDLPGLLSRAATATGHVAPVVWLPPLPSVITSAEGSDGRAWAVADRPDEQRRAELAWRPDAPLAVVGSARSGRSTALRSLVRAAGPAWLYVLDLGRALAGTELSRHPGLRSWVAPDDVAHGLRTMEVLGRLVEDRLAAGPPSAGQGHVPVVVVVDGWERWVESYDQVDRGRGVDLLLRLLREGPAAGVVALLSGGGALLGGAVSGLVAETWALRLHDPGDVLRAGLRPRQVPRDQPPGRVVRTRDGLVAQVVTPDEDRQLRANPDLDAGPAGPPPPAVRTLPRSLPAGGPWAVGGDEAQPLPLPGGPVLVLGPPGSGVTATLEALARGTGDGDILRIGPGLWEESHLDSALRTFRGTVVVDQAHLLSRTRTEDLVLEWSGRTGGRLLVGGDLDACSAVFAGLVPHVARHRTGVVLHATSPAQGAVLGVRLPVGEPRLPGRGVLVVAGSCVRVQVAQPGLSPRRAGP